MMLRFPSGYRSPMHTHSSNYHAVIVEGHSMHRLEGEDEATSEVHGPESYWMQPADQIHDEATPGDGPVTIFVHFEGRSTSCQSSDATRI
ncbi:hypothetical protein DEA8626_02046 [Defluviimonas aquaemixtae]|uniref:Cupin 2 conserved barrel domain-containing protein n=1 Tax=Albidovulum aquaemixtae TaxID=1542388 RepID=A0A2R8B7A1_9RHOB|nr:hypothetical protein [Defluviimonas aquaemixtae]SPH18507.1 hypothetical protein DEA8626_02046 [Defluviimonas aquaemixtae]